MTETKPPTLPRGAQTGTENLTPDAARLLDPYAAAEYLGMARQTLAVWRTQRKGPRYLKLGRSVRYRRGDLRTWAERHAVAGEGATAEEVSHV